MRIIEQNARGTVYQCRTQSEVDKLIAKYGLENCSTVYSRSRRCTEVTVHATCPYLKFYGRNE